MRPRLVDRRFSEASNEGMNVVDEIREEHMAAKRGLTAAALFALSLFLSVSFVSFDGISPEGAYPPFANLCGSLGQSIAGSLLKTFGAGAFALSFFGMFIGYSVLISREISSPFLKCIGALVFTIVLSTSLQAFDPMAGYGNSPYPLGGVAGDQCSILILHWFGGFGATLILLLLACASLVLATDRFLIDLALGVPALFSGSLSRLKLPTFAFAGNSGAASEAAVKTAKKKTKKKSGPKKKAKKKAQEEIAEELVEEDENEGLVDMDEPEMVLEDIVDGETDDDFLYEGEVEGEDSLSLLDEDLTEDPETEDAWLEEEYGEEEDEEDQEEEIIRTDPIIRRGGANNIGEGVEILMLSREKHLEGKETYELPPLSLLEDPVVLDVEERDGEIRRKARKLEETLETFGISAQVVEISRGPTITVYELELAAGTKVKRITSLPDDISLALKAKTIRIVAPIPGKAAVGIEVPNETRETVFLKTLACSEALRSQHYNIPLLLGMNAAGDALIEDLTSMPHLLIAGQTGAGKSVCINSIIASLLLTKYPEEVRLILIDPKMVELQAFRDVPHLLTPVVTDMKKAPKILEWAVNEMEHRYELLSAAGVRDIKGYNSLDPEELEERVSEHFTMEEIEKMQKHLPYVVLIVDELADLMMTSAKEVEQSICRLAQKSRAVGIHVILATQRPSVDVITGLIKSNMPSRLSFRTASKIDSRTILDQMGAERLLGRGDMLFMSPRSGGGPVRCQAALVSDDEIKSLVRYIKEVAQPEYSRELTQVPTSSTTNEEGFQDRDALYNDAVRAVLASQRGSVSMLQRKLGVGYTRAARLVDFMAEDGIVGNFKGSKAREVMLTLEDWEKQQGA